MYGTLFIYISDLLSKGSKNDGIDLLLEEDRAETRVESSDTLVLQDLAETSGKTVGETRFRNKTDTGGLERAESDVSKELGGTSGSKVDGSSVLAGGVVSEHVDTLLLEEFVTTELESSLDEVTGSGWAETSEESTGSFILDELSESTDHTPVVGSGIELDLRLDAAEISKSEQRTGEKKTQKKKTKKQWEN